MAVAWGNSLPFGAEDVDNGNGLRTCREESVFAVPPYDRRE